jgi:spoIIIJ-associated protein
MLEEIQKLTLTFFEKLWTDFSDLDIIEEAEHIYRISLKSDDSHLLIGPHGKNLEILTHLLKLLIAKKSQEHINIHVEVNDYLKQKDAKLLSFIQAKIDIVKSSGKEIILPFFTAYERKKVHSFVTENWGNVFTESQWEGKDRRIHLCRKDEKITIDIDGDDI